MDPGLGRLQLLLQRRVLALQEVHLSVQARLDLGTELLEPTLQPLNVRLGLLEIGLRALQFPHLSLKVGMQCHITFLSELVLKI